MRVLVLGGMNFVGRAIASRLLVDHDVAVLNRGTQPTPDPRMVHLVVDRLDPTQVGSVVRSAGSFDAVVDVSATEPAHIRRLLDGCSADLPERYVFISSAAVYSPNGSQPRVESDPCHGDPVWGGYGEEKAACEALLRTQGPRSLTILRPPYVYGPENNEQREQWLWARMLSGNWIFVPGEGQACVQFCHVEFLAGVVAAAVDSRLPSGTYNVGDDRYYTFDEYLTILGDISGRTPRLMHVGHTGVGARSYFPFRDIDLTLDTAKLQQTGLPKGPGLAQGLSDAWRWFSQGELLDVPTPQEVLWRRNPPDLADGRSRIGL